MGSTRQAGMSLLEFTLVIVVISALSAVFLNWTAGLRVEVERAAVRQTLNNMRSALAIRFAELYIQGDDAAIAAWKGGNALSLIESLNRRGEAPDGAAAEPAGPGEWAYEDGVIVYRPSYPRALTGDPEAVGRWRVIVEGSSDEPRGLRLEAVQPLLADRTNREGDDRGSNDRAAD
jgi:hypothetical protein